MKLKQMLTKADQLKKLGTEAFKTGEHKVRSVLDGAFEKGLEIAGHNLMRARKAKEAFVAETHRKAKNVQDTTATIENFKEFISPRTFHEETYVKDEPKESISEVNKKVSASFRKRQHSAGISRSH